MKCVKFRLEVDPDNKVHAIKLLRSVTKLSLREAKDIADEHIDNPQAMKIAMSLEQFGMFMFNQYETMAESDVLRANVTLPIRPRDVEEHQEPEGYYNCVERPRSAHKITDKSLADDL